MGELINGRTQEEIKKQLGCCSKEMGCIECPEVADGDCSLKLCANAISLIERLESERDAALAKVPKWIRVEDVSPKENVYYLVSVTLYGNMGMYTDVAMFDGELWVRDAGSYFDVLDKGDITHYMPLPEPQKEESNA